ncbi:MAG: helix-turn-helix transcriptional regulator, partial [Lachnospiraceae bacterium]|nr:helix-turn-helix transcriptional regulator [Lachnospiraceae bacterium]
MLFLLLSILLVIAYLTYRVIYNPVRLAADRISQVTEQQILPGEDELDFMTGSVNRMHTHNTALSSQLAELFIMRVMRGEISDKDIDSYLAQDAARQMPASYRIVTITLCYEGDNYDEQFAVRDACGRRLVEYLSDNYGTLLFLNPIYSSRAVICIIGEEEKDPSDSKAEMIYSAARSYIEQYPDFHAGVGVSGVHHSMHNLTAAYRESVFALNKPHSEEAPEDREQVNELQEGPVESYCRYYKKAEEAYPSINSSEYEQQLLEGIRLADKDMAYDAVNRLIRSLKENPLEDGGEVPVLLRIVNTIILGARQNNIIIDGLFRNDLRMVYRNIIGFFDLDETRRYIKYVLIDPVIDNAQYNMFSQSRAIMNAVEQVVEEKKGNVTLAECAEALNYDSSYIWKILKKEKGVTFTEYVEQYRLRMAKQLLEETDMTISAIASELYYTNAQNFIRFFSRMEGTTPGKYR